MSRILIGALSGWQKDGDASTREVYRERRRRCFETWFQDCPGAGCDAVFLLGWDPQDAPATWPREPMRDEAVLLLPCKNEYAHLPARTREFCRWALGNSGQWDYLFKCDDDTYVAPKRLASLVHVLRSKPQAPDYVGCPMAPTWPNLAAWRARGHKPYASGGAGYLLSRRAAEIVARDLPQTDEVRGAEDLAVGRVLDRAGIELVECREFVPYGRPGLVPAPDNSLITAHAIGGELWEETHARMAGFTASIRPE